MNPDTLALILYMEQLAAHVALTVAEIRAANAAAGGKTVAEILDDADAKWAQVRAKARTSQ